MPHRSAKTLCITLPTADKILHLRHVVGMSVADICERYRVTRNTLLKIIRQAGKPPSELDKAS